MKTARSSRSSTAMTSSNRSNEKSQLFVNDDYDYLINCTDLITTCQEALQENNHCLPDKQSSPLVPPPAPNIYIETINCDDHHQQSVDLSSTRSPSSAASSGLGLSIEEELKYCHSDEEFSSLNSLSNSNEHHHQSNNTTTNSNTNTVKSSNAITGSYTAKALMAEFIEWLDYIENQLDSVCYCAKIAQDANGPNCAELIDQDLIKNFSENHQKIDDNVAANHHHHQNHDLSETQQIQSNKNELQLDSIVSNDDFVAINDGHVDDDDDDLNEDDELVVEADQNDQPVIDDCQTSNNSNSHEYSFQMLSKSSKANLILPETMADWSVILARHEAYQNEYEKIVHQFFKNIDQLTKPGYGGTSSNGDGNSTNSGSTTPNNNNIAFERSIKQQKNRCLNLWIKSLEYLTILQNYYGKRCPRHYLASNKSSLLNGFNINGCDVNEQQQQQQQKPEQSSSTPSSLIVHHRPQQHIFLSSTTTKSDRKLLNRSYYNNLFDRKNYRHRFYQENLFEQQQSTSTPNIDNLDTKPTRRVVELRSTGTGGSSVIIQNRRVQTRQTSTSSNSTMIGQQQQQPRDTHSLDGSGSPGADSGVFSSSMDNSKFEIIQKDIGYSSDADMSDAIEAQPQSSDPNNLQRSSKKRQVRRRRTRTSRNRPWSFHSDWSTWDYYQTPFFCNGEHFSNEDLNYHDENIIRKLTEFGENYESWINTELDTDTDVHLCKDIKPAVVIEKPEIEADYDNEPVASQAPVVVERQDACISTSPIPFSDKECQVIVETILEEDKVDVGVEANFNENELNSSLEHKSTQTKVKRFIDTACMTTQTRSPTPEPKHKNKNVPKTTTTNAASTTHLKIKTCHCNGHHKMDDHHHSNDSPSYSSIKFYTSIALAGLLSFLIAVTQFSPEIHKTYPRPPPL